MIVNRVRIDYITQDHKTDHEIFELQDADIIGVSAYINGGLVDVFLQQAGDTADYLDSVAAATPITSIKSLAFYKKEED